MSYHLNRETPEDKQSAWPQTKGTDGKLADKIKESLTIALVSQKELKSTQDYITKEEYLATNFKWTNFIDCELCNSHCL